MYVFVFKIEVYYKWQSRSWAAPRFAAITNCQLKLLLTEQKVRLCLNIPALTRPCNREHMTLWSIIIIFQPTERRSNAEYYD